MTKECKVCKIEKLASEFSMHHGRTLRSECKACRSATWRAQNQLPKVKAYRIANAKNQKLKSAYGISLEIFNKMALDQNYLCGIEHCGTTLKLDKNTHVDHDHVTGKVRKLLCADCNRGLGLLHEDFDRALGIAKYIQEHKGII